MQGCREPALRTLIRAEVSAADIIQALASSAMKLERIVRFARCANIAMPQATDIVTSVKAMAGPNSTGRPPVSRLSTALMKA